MMLSFKLAYRFDMSLRNRDGNVCYGSAVSPGGEQRLANKPKVAVHLRAARQRQVSMKTP